MSFGDARERIAERIGECTELTVSRFCLFRRKDDVRECIERGVIDIEDDDGILTRSRALNRLHRIDFHACGVGPEFLRRCRVGFGGVEEWHQIAASRRFSLARARQPSFGQIQLFGRCISGDALRFERFDVLVFDVGIQKDVPRVVDR